MPPPRENRIMKKILFVVNTLGVGGAERTLLDLLDSLDRRLYAIDLYVLLGRGQLMDQVPEGVRLLNNRADGGSVLDGAGRRALVWTVAASFFRNGGCAGKLAGILRALPPMVRNRRIQLDKLLWRGVSDGAVRPEGGYDTAVAWIGGKKLAVVHIDYEQSGYTRALDQDCWSQFERIFVVSKEIQAPFLRVYPEHGGKLQELPNLVNQDKIRRLAQGPGGFSDCWDGLRLLSVGRLTYQKAFEVSIEAMKLLKDAGFRVRWYVLGEGDQRGALEKKIAALGLQEDFFLLGTVENPYPYYAQSDIYVHATRFEGRSIAIQEAQTLGCAMVVSDTSGNRIQVTQDQDGLLCSLSPMDVARTVGLLLSDRDRRRRLGDAAARRKEKTVDRETIQTILGL